MKLNLFLSLLLLASCNPTPEAPTADAIKVAEESKQLGAPVFSPNGGTFQGSVAVSLSSSTDGAYFYHTLDGSDPVCGPRVDNIHGQIIITSTATLKAVSCRKGGASSSITTALFTIIQVNQGPVVSAGADKNVQLPNSVTLTGVATDDGLPNPPAKMTHAWSKVSGPGTVTFGSASSLMTTASFSATGTYVLRLTSSDSALSASDDMSVVVSSAPVVNQAPVVSAGSAQTITLPSSASLNGSVTDDGLPVGSTLTRTWSKVSGPGTVTFGNASAQVTTASFSVAGSYVLMLTGSDGTLSATSNVTITVNAAVPPISNNCTHFAAKGVARGTGLGTQASPWNIVDAVKKPAAAIPAGSVLCVRGGTYVAQLKVEFSGTATQPIIIKPFPGETVVLDGHVKGTLTQGVPTAGGYTTITEYFASFPGTEGFPDHDGLIVFSGTRSVFENWQGGAYDYSNPGRYVMGVRGWSGTTPRAWAAGTEVINRGDVVQLAGNYIHLIGFEITSSETYKDVQGNDFSDGNGINFIGSGVKAINNVIHDVPGNGIHSSQTSLANEAYGNIIYNNGVMDPGGPACHALYLQGKQDGSRRLISDNLMFNPINLCTQVWYNDDRGDVLKGFHFEKNAFSRCRWLIGGNAASDDIKVSDNYGYEAAPEWGYGHEGNLSGVMTNNIVTGGIPLNVLFWERMTVTGNKIVHNGGVDGRVARIQDGPNTQYANYNINNNQYYSPFNDFLTKPYGAGLNYNTFTQWKALGFDANGTYTPGRPTGTDIQVSPNRYDPTRANIMVFNWSRSATISVNLAGTGIQSGETFVIKDAQNFYGPAVLSGTYSGSAVSITMPGAGAAVPQPRGNFNGRLAARTHTDIEFGMFVLIINRTSTQNPTNQAPTVSAGSSQTITLPATATLSGSVSDDGLPSNTLTQSWSKVSGPGSVAFANASQTSTSASFSAAGSYSLRLTATDGALSATSDVSITVNAAPVANMPPFNVNAGADRTHTMPGALALVGSALDDGLPNPPGAMTHTWSKVSGPGTVTFSASTSLMTNVTFSAAGSYVLRLMSFDSMLSSSDELTVTVSAAPQVNQAPQVAAGIDRTVTLPNTLALVGAATDDGLPNPPAAMTHSWGKVSGPGTVTFSAPTSLTTSVSFSAAGTYVLRLTSSDSSLTAFDELSVVVSSNAPVANVGTNNTVTLPNALALNGSVAPAGTTALWSKVSGPGTVTFTSSTSASTSASFSAAGAYVLRLTATNGTQSTSANLNVTVNAASSGPLIQLNPSIGYQRINGWEATAQDGALLDDGNPAPGFDVYKNTMFNMAVNDLGINRLRVEVFCGMENDQDYFTLMKNGQVPYRCSGSDTNCYRFHRYSPKDDNGTTHNPNQINPARFHFEFLEHQIENTYMPMQALAQARGERIHLNVNYVCFNEQQAGMDPLGLHNDPAEYAEFVLAVYKHLQQKYSLTPDSWEMLLEPEYNKFYKGTSAFNGGQRLGASLKAAKILLEQNGFSNPKFIAPSVTAAGNAPAYADGMASVSGFPWANVFELGFHRYDSPDETKLANIRQKATQYGVTSAMLEFGGATYEHLHQDLKTANVSGWQQYTLSYPGSDDGWSYIPVNGTTPALSVYAKYLRQYFKFIREGAQRIEATMPPSNFDPVAFINTNGKYVVVVRAFAGGSFSIQGLPAGTYGIKYTTASQYNIDHSDVSLSGGNLSTNIPAAGVITIYGK